MLLSRRVFLVDSGLALASVAVGCRAPLVRSRGVRRVVQIIPGIETSDGAGVRLRRLIGQPPLADLDPFVLLDRFHSGAPEDYVRGFPSHPHRGFETVTILVRGRFRHADSRGNHGVIVGGGAQWMTAGRGIVHSEMPDQTEGWLSGYQLWVNLPAREKMRAQEYQDLPPAQLREARLGNSGSALRLIAGRFDGLAGPVRERTTAPLLATLALEDETPVEIDVPRGHAAFVAVHEGELRVGDHDRDPPLAAGALAVLGEGEVIRVRAVGQRGTALVAAGRPLREPIARRGPFVMSTEEELRRAFEDFRAGRLDV